MACFQETKLNLVETRIVKEICGNKLRGYRHLEAQGTRGGILLAWSEMKFQSIQCTIKDHTVTVDFLIPTIDITFRVAGVYGPSRREGRAEFLQELRDSKPSDDKPWSLCGDFNITLMPEDRSSQNQNWRDSLDFASLLTELGLTDLNLQGRSLTWSNAREIPTMARLDRFLLSASWFCKIPTGCNHIYTGY